MYMYMYIEVRNAGIVGHAWARYVAHVYTWEPEKERATDSLALADMLLVGMSKNKQLES